MVNVIEALRKGDTDFLDYHTSDGDIRTIFELIRKQNDYVDILKKTLPKLIQLVRGQIIFDNIYDIVELKEYSYYLVIKNRVSLDYLNSEQVKNMMNSSIWGPDFILHNLAVILDKDSYNKIIAIVESIIDNNELCTRFLNGFISKVDYTRRVTFVTSLINRRKGILEELSYDIDNLINQKECHGIQMVIEGAAEEEKPQVMPHDNLSTLLTSFINYDVTDENVIHLCDRIIEHYGRNDVGKELLKTKREQLRQYLISNFEPIFKSSNAAKMDMLNSLRGSLEPNIIREYQYLLSMFNMIDSPGFDCQQIFSNILNYDLYDYFKNVTRKYYDKSESKEFRYLQHGITSHVFRIGDYVIKLGNFRYSSKCPKHYRILNEEERRVVLDENKKPIFYIEIQKYVNQNLNKITDDMIYQLFVDLKNSGLELTDPCSLKYQPSNFALLDNCEESDFKRGPVSESFKENPLVLIDLDLVYRKNDKNKQYFRGQYDPSDYTMDQAISDYERAVGVSKKIK